MAYDIPETTGTITTVSGTQGAPAKSGSFGYCGSSGNWCPFCKAEGKYNWIEEHDFCIEHATREAINKSREWSNECAKSWGIKL